MENEVPITVGPIDGVEFRKLNIWVKRVLKPHAAANTMGALRQELDTAEIAFQAALKGVPDNEFIESVCEGYMSPAGILGHLSIAIAWQTSKLLEIRTGQVAPDDVVTQLFESQPGDMRKHSVERLKDSFAVLRDEAAKAEEGDTTSHHIWFGPLNAKEWIASAVSHFDVHRSQIESRKS